MAPHIAHIDYSEFFKSAFPTIEEAHGFVNLVEEIPKETCKAKIVIHQAARLLWLSDRIDDVAKGRPALLIMFYMIAAEAVAKLVFKFQGKGQSRKYVQRFFADLCDEKHQLILKTAFWKDPSGPHLTVSQAVDLLYDIRCDVVHEGQYFSLQLPNLSDPDRMLIIHRSESLIASITSGEIRQIILEGSLIGARRMVPMTD